VRRKKGNTKVVKFELRILAIVGQAQVSIQECMRLAGVAQESNTKVKSTS